jgi:hypothetical protein
MEFESETRPLGNPDSVKNKRALAGGKTEMAAQVRAAPSDEGRRSSFSMTLLFSQA